MAALVLALSPQRIVIGGGVGYGQRWLLPRVHEATLDRLAGYVAAVDAELDRVADRAGRSRRRRRSARFGRHRTRRPRTSVASAADDIRAAIEEAGGAIPFSEFQRLALYGSDGLLHPRRRRAGRPPRRVVPHIARGRSAVRRRAGALPRRPVGGARTTRSVHRRRRRRRSRHARPLDPRRPSGLPGGDALRRRRAVGGATGASSGRGRVSSGPPGRTDRRCHHRQRVARQPAVPPVRVRRRMARGVRRRRPTARSPRCCRRRSIRRRSACRQRRRTARGRRCTTTPSTGSSTPGRGCGRGRLLAVDYWRPTTSALAARPWREWLRTYRGHRRGDHYLADPGGQDITVELALDQFPEPDAVSTQAQFLQRWGIDELVAEGDRQWAASAAAPDLGAVGDAQPRRRGEGPARPGRPRCLRGGGVVGYGLRGMSTRLGGRSPWRQPPSSFSPLATAASPAGRRVGSDDDRHADHDETGGDDRRPDDVGPALVAAPGGRSQRSRADAATEHRRHRRRARRAPPSVSRSWPRR